ncbi:MAG: lactate racemase domain-containing protein [Thermacetogeniaceae bacterium]
MILPLMYKGILRFPGPAIEDVAKQTSEAFAKARFWSILPPNSTVAVTVGSRGIADIVKIVRTVVSMLKERGYYPFILPAMGSHGGGTAEGQKKVLAELGITEETVGAPIRASEEAELIGNIAPDLPVFCNKLALECDGIVVVNRVKPHTSFHGPIESGLLKMLAVGLGNPQGAAVLHKFGPSGLRTNIPLVGKYMIGKLPILYGIAVVENAYDQTALIEGIEPQDFYEREKILLETARSLMPHLPFDDIDLLIVREMGKCFSGTGMDTNIIGRLRIQGEKEPERPRIKRIVVLDLAEASKGNAAGIGLADFTTDHLLSKVDWEATYMNVLTTTFTQRAMIPMHFPTEEITIKKALDSLGTWKTEDVRIVIIKNTLELDEIYFSEALLPEATKLSNLTVVGEGQRLSFIDGRLGI